MREVKYLSPTSISKFLDDKEQFYLDYMAPKRAPRMAQTRPMSIGSAFDAYVKSALYKRLVNAGDPKFDFENLFESQVEVHNRDWARQHGLYVFQQYESTGALSDLIIELNKAIGTPRFELDVVGTVTHNFYGVVLLGKPDLFFVHASGMFVISDWKVNGYCSKSAISPAKGYVKILPDYMPHKEAVLKRHNGMLVNAGCQLKDIDLSWARQTVIYAWLCGCPVGSEFVHAIDQVVCNNRKNPNPGVGHPELRFAQHRYLCDVQFQFDLFEQITQIWECVRGGPEKFFSELGPEESVNKCNMLNKLAEAAGGISDPDFMEVTGM